MADVDKFGFRIGSKRATAAKLYERGATQADMVAATGTTQYNMLEDAKRRGHRVDVKGDRYWLIAAAESPGRGGLGMASLIQRRAPIAAPRRPAVGRATRANGYELVSAVPAILSIIGWHGDESPEDIVNRKSKDIANAGMTVWVIQSWKAKTDAVQAFGQSHPGATVYFLEGGSIPTKEAQAAVEMSEDRRTWIEFPNRLGKVTGKLGGATGLVLDRLTLCSSMSIDLWQFSEHPASQPLKFVRGASTACTVPAGSPVAGGMIDHHRNVVAIGRLAKPFAVYLR